jgi:hypothetical protein
VVAPLLLSTSAAAWCVALFLNLNFETRIAHEDAVFIRRHIKAGIARESGQVGYIFRLGGKECVERILGEGSREFFTSTRKVVHGAGSAYEEFRHSGCILRASARTTLNL